MSPETDNPLAVFSGQLAALVDRVAAGVVAVHGRDGAAASGLLWRQGVVVTAEEALGHDEDHAVTLPNARRVAATLAGRDPSTDIAVLRFEDDAAVPPRIDRADAARAGEIAIAVGRREEGPVASLGIIALAGGPWRSLRGGKIDQRIHADLRLDGRAEGGALVDAAGKLIGMTVFAPRRRVLAIPTSTIERVVEQLLARGRIARGYLGAGLRPVRLDAGVMRSLSLAHDRAAIIVSVDDSGPARRAGLMLGDMVTSWNGEPIRGVRDVIVHLGSDSVGETVKLALIRAGAAASATITIGERPAP